MKEEDKNNTESTLITERQVEIVLNIEKAEPQNEEERRFTEQVKRIMQTGGVVDIPT
jgi:Cft2 family RNA processing exonuclease